MANFKLEPSSPLSAVDRGVSRSFLLLVFLSLGMGIFAQMRLPDALNKHLKESEYKGLYSGSDFEGLKSGTSGRAWKVWSDRDNNTVYKSLSSPNNPSDSKADWEADFMEEFVVFDVRKNIDDKIFLNIKSLVKNKSQKEGWIPLKKTLVSPKAYANKFGLTKKYMVLTPEENFVKKSERSSSERFYNSPDPYTDANYAEVNRFTILFALKREQGKLLLSSSSDFSQLNSGKTAVVSGWFHEESLTPWDSRIGYAPNHGSAIATAGDGTLPVYESELQAKLYWETGKKTKSLTSYNILDSEPTNWAEVFPPMPSITQIQNRDESSISDFEKELKEVVVLVCAGSAIDCEKNINIDIAEKKKFQEQLEHLNVYFILDGTNSMKPFIQGAKDAIAEVVASLDDEQKKFFSVGYTVYRDYPDGKKNAVVTSRRTTDHARFLEEIGNIECFSDASTRAEAFYQGLKLGIETANFEEARAQNLLVIIGDAGNHIIDKMSFADVESALADKRVTIFGFQTNNGAHSSYLDFTQDLVRLASLGNSDRDWQEESDGKFTNQSLSKEEIKAWETESTIYIGNSSGESTDPFRMSADIVNAIDKMNEKRKQVTFQVYQAEASAKPLPITGEGIPNFGAGIPASKTGYIATKTEKNQTPAFIPYVFLLDADFNKLINAFGVFAGATTDPRSTKEFINSLLLTLGSITGDNLDDPMLRRLVLNKTLNQIWLDYLQVPCELPFANQKLKDLRKWVEEDDNNLEPFVFAVEDFKKKAKLFARLSKSTHEWQPLLGTGKPFYWVPFSSFPGSQ